MFRRESLWSEGLSPLPEEILLWSVQIFTLVRILSLSDWYRYKYIKLDTLIIKWKAPMTIFMIIWDVFITIKTIPSVSNTVICPLLSDIYQWSSISIGDMLSIKRILCEWQDINWDLVCFSWLSLYTENNSWK